VIVEGHNPIKCAQVAGRGRTAAGSGYSAAGNSTVASSTYQPLGVTLGMQNGCTTGMLEAPDLLGADTPPLGSVLVTQSGRTATGERIQVAVSVVIQ
jgi:hypothetical protein